MASMPWVAQRSRNAESVECLRLRKDSKQLRIESIQSDLFVFLVQPFTTHQNNR